MNRISALFFMVIGLLISGSSIGQDNASFDADQAFMEARELAFNGQRAEARKNLETILNNYPNYVDVHNLLAKTYSWDGDYEDARKHFNRITSVHRKNREVWIAAVNNEVYAGNLNIALGLSNKALKFMEGDSTLVQMRERILADMESTTEEKEEVIPEPKNRFALLNSVDVFDVMFDPMVYGSLEYERSTPWGKVLPRINYANRFNTQGIQAELDLYPKISKTLYAYLNYGYSKATVFPTHRGGAELYANLPKAMEVSAGMRALSFSEGRTALIYTGSYGMYRGNYYFSLRPYYSIVSGRQGGVSGSLDLRRYFSTKDHYLGLRANYGFATEFKQLYDGTTLLAETLLFVESQQALFEYQFGNTTGRHLYKAQLGVTRQEMIFDPGQFFWSLTGGIQYNIRF